MDPGRATPGRMSARDTVDSRIPSTDLKETPARESPNQRSNRADQRFCTRQRQVVNHSGALGRLVQNEEHHGNQTRAGQEFDQSHDNDRRGRELTGPSVLLNRKQLQTKFTSYISLRFPPKRRRTSELKEHRAAELSCSVQDSPGPRGVSQQVSRRIPHLEISVEPVSHQPSLEKTSHPVQDNVAAPPTGSGYLTSDQRQTTDNGTTDSDTNPGAVESQTLEPPTAHTQQLEPTDAQRCRPSVTKRSVNSLVSRVSSERTDLQRLDSRGGDTSIAATACTSSLGVDDCLRKGSASVVTQNSSVAVLPAAMLSSTMVSVLAPNWSARRRQKRAEQEAQGSQQEVIEGGRFSTLQNTQEVERGDTPGSPSQGRAPSLGYGDSTSPVSPVSSSMVSRTATLPLSRELHAQQGISQAGHYGDKLSFLSSKPKTSSLLFSLRRVHSASPTQSNPAPPTLSRSINDRAAGSSIQQSSSASNNDTEQERSKSLLSSSSTPYRIIERSWPHHLLTSHSQRQADTHHISTSPSHQEPETSSVYLTPPYSPKHTTLSSGLELTKEDNLTSSRPSQHGRLDFLTRPSSRRTQLKASWCKTKDQSFSSSPLSPANNVNNQKCENNNNMSPSSDSSNKTVQGIQANLNSGRNPQSTDNANNNDLSKLGHHGNTTFPDSWANLSALRLTGSPQEPGDKHSHPPTSPTQPTDTPSSHTPTLCEIQQDLRLTEAPSERQVQRPHSLSSVYYSTRMRCALSPTTFNRSTLGLNRTEPGLDHGHGGESLTTCLGSQLRTHNPGSLLSSSSKSSSSPSVPSSYTPRPCRFSSGPVSTTFCSTSTDPPPSPGSSSSIPQPLLPNHTTSSQFSLPSKAAPATKSANTNTSSQPFSPRNSSMPFLSPKLSHTPNPTSPPDSPLTPQSPLTQGMKLCSAVEPRVLASWSPWQDSVELHSGETSIRGQHFPPGSPPGLTSPISPSRQHRSVEGPSIFASLRSGGSSRAPSPRSPSGARSSSLSVWRGEREKLSPSHSFPESAGKTGGEVEGEKEEEKEKQDREKEGREKKEKDLSGRSLKFTFDHTGNGASGTISQRMFSKESASSSNYNTSVSLQSDFGSRSRLSLSPPPYHTLKASSPTRTSPTSPTTSFSKSPSKSLSSSPHCALPISPPISPYSPTLAHRQTSSWDRSKDVVTENNRSNGNNTAQTLHDSVGLQTSRIETHVNDVTRPSPTPFSADADKPRPPSSRVTVVETLVYTIPSSSSSSKDGIQLSHSYSGLQSLRTVIAKSDPLQIAHHRQLTGGISCQSQKSSNDSNALGQQCSPANQIKGNLLEHTDKGCRERGIPVTEKKSERGWRGSDSPPETLPPGQANRKGLFRNKKERPATITPAATLARGTETAQTERNKRDAERREGEVERRERANEKDKRGPTKMDLVLQRLKQTFNIKWQSDELPSRRKRASLPTSDLDAAPDAKVISVTSNRGRGQEREIQRDGSVQTSLAQGTRREGGGEGGRVGGRVQTDREMTQPDISPAGIRTGNPQFGVLRGQGWGQDRHWSSMIDLSSPDALRSPLSSPSSPLSRKDWEGDSVFYSPAPQHRWGRKKASSFCESGDRETGGQESQVRGQGGVLASYSSCADLKYGLKAGRTISVSSVLSSRPSCPRRISTGPDMVGSVTDLHDPAVTSRGVAWVDQSAGKEDWFMTNRSGFRSLPRHGTKGLEVASLSLSSSLDFLWDVGGPPTPPLTPPSRRMSRSSSTSPSSPPCSAGGWVSPDSHASRGRLPSRGYVSSLSAFEESDADLDTSSDTTTDDEYYLGDGDAEEKETEL